MNALLKIRICSRPLQAFVALKRRVSGRASAHSAYFGAGTCVPLQIAE